VSSSKLLFYFLGIRLTTRRPEDARFCQGDQVFAGSLQRRECASDSEFLFSHYAFFGFMAQEQKRRKGEKFLLSYRFLA